MERRIEEISLADYLDAIENCPDEFVEDTYKENDITKKYKLSRLERDFGLEDNYNMALEGDRVDFLKYLVHSGKYNFKRGGLDPLNFYTEFYILKWKSITFNDREKNRLLYPRCGPSDLVVDDYRTKLLYVNDVLEEIGLPFDKKEGERRYNIGLQLHPASAGVLRHIGKYIMENNLEFINNRKRYYGREVAVTNHRSSDEKKKIILL